MTDRIESRSSRHIGIVAVSAEGAALCYRTICAEGATILGSHNHPQITMHTFPLSDYMRAIEADRWGDVGEMLLASAAILVRAGAEILICPDNTVHRALDPIRHALPAPWLHIAEEVAELAARQRYRKVGILGTRYLMEGPVYPATLLARNIQYDVPEVKDRQRINTIIFDELVYGRLETSSRDYVIQMIDRLKQGGCDAVVLGCTEIPLLIGERDSPLPTIDSTRALARAALSAATSAVGR